MRDALLKSGRDGFLVAIPLLVLMFAGFFRLDELFGAPAKGSRPRGFGGGQDEDGEPIVSDPDGTPAAPRGKSR